MFERLGTRPARGLATLAAVIALGAMVLPARAQEVDDRWLPWLGCWLEVDTPADAPMLCVVPEGEGVAAMAVTRAGPTQSSAWIGDGVARPVATSGCTGEEATEFSSDGRRIYVRSQQTCEGEVERSTRSLIAMVDDDQWIYARAMDVAGRSVAYVKRYRPAPAARVEGAGMADRLAAVESRAEAVDAARLAASAPITVEALIEAHARTDAEAVRAWIAERGEPIRLDADRLVELADAGVPPEIIDVAIAVSFPERFAVAREPQRNMIDDRRAFTPWGYYGFFDPFYYDPYFYNLGYRYPYYGYYGAWSRPYYGYNYGPTVVVVRPTDSDDGGGVGRVVKGRGYTRTTGSTVARPSGASRATVGSSSSGSTSRATGSRSSGSSGSKGKAKPKGGGR
jgi:hypothetical protein